VTTYLHCYKTLRQEIKTFQEHTKNEKQDEDEEGTTTPMIPATTVATTVRHDPNNNNKKEEPMIAETNIIMNQFVHHVSATELQQLIHHVDQNGYYGLERFLGYDAYTRYYQSITHVREIVAYYHRITLPNRHPPSHHHNNINKNYNNKTTMNTVVTPLPPTKQLPMDRINILWEMTSHHAISKSMMDRDWALFMGYVMSQHSSSSSICEEC
jgi:hypothetical protein